MAQITNSNALDTSFTPGATGLFRCSAIGGAVQLMTSADSGATWAPCGAPFEGAVDVNNLVSGMQYKYSKVNGNPTVRADQ